MASNFRIYEHQNTDSLHLKLTGDFDGSSAREVLHVLQNNYRKASQVFIHCSCLNKIEPSGRAVFQDNINALKDDSKRFLFTGDKASQIAPEGSQCL